MCNEQESESEERVLKGQFHPEKRRRLDSHRVSTGDD